MSVGNYRIAVGLVLLLIIYGSLYPLTWNFAQPQPFIFLGPVGLIDLVENIVLFLPLGWLLAWQYHQQPHQWRAFSLWFVIALAVASMLQWLQIYLPRTPALSDIVFNMVGHVAGWVAGSATAHAMRRILDRHQALRAADRFALVIIGLWLVAELFPLIPTFDVSSVFGNVKSLWQQDAWQPRRMVLHIGTTVMGLDAVTQLLRSAALGSWARKAAALVTLAVLAGKFVIVNQAPGLAVVAGILSGAVLWWAIDLVHGDRRPMLLMLNAVATYLVSAIWPLDWRDVPLPMEWLPFASSLSNTIESVITSVAFDSLCFGALIWAAVRMGARLTGLTICTALLAFCCEWLQRYLPTRTPEITAVVLAVAMGWLVGALRPRPEFAGRGSSQPGSRHRRRHRSAG